MCKKYFFMLLFFLVLPIVMAHLPEEGHSIFEWNSLQHVVTFVISIAAVVSGFITYSKIKKQSTNYLIAGVIALGLIHFTEFLAESLEFISLSETALSNIEHILSISGLVLLGYGFYLMKNEQL